MFVTPTIGSRTTIKSRVPQDVYPKNLSRGLVNYLKIKYWFYTELDPTKIQVPGWHAGSSLKALNPFKFSKAGGRIGSDQDIL